jgi:hypothetical protein
VASDTVTYKLGLDASGFARGVQTAEKSLSGLSKGADSTASRFGKMADAIGKTSTTLARSASLFGLPVGALRAIDDAADVAEIGLKNLSKSAVGFNTASLGVAAAGFAIGYSLGSLARSTFPELAKAADNAAAAMLRLVTSQKELDKQALGFGSQKDWMARTNAVEKHAEAQKKQFAMLKNMGMTPDQMKIQMGFEKKKDPMLQMIEAFEKGIKDSQKAMQDAQKGMEQWVKSAEVARAAWDKFYKDLATGARNAAFDVSKLLGQRALDRGGNPFEQMQRQVSLNMGGSGRLLSEETTNVSKFWSRDPDIQKELDASGGRLFGEATASGIDFSKMLGDVAHAFQVLGVGSNSVLGKLVGTLSVVGGALDSLNAAKASGATGLAGLLGKAVPALGLASAGFSLIKGLFGGKSKEEKEAERKQAEEQRRRIQDAAKQMRTSSVDALGSTGSAFFGARTIHTKAEAEHQGVLFAAAWGQVVKEKGIVAAADAFGEAFDKMKADIDAAGLEMPAWMQAISGQMGLGKNESFRAAANMGQTGAAFLGAMGGSGGLGPEEFRAFEQEARATFAAGEKAATEAGLESAEATKAGFSATNPLLQELLNQSVVSGQTLSADIQEMIEAANIVPDVDIQQLDELRQIRAAVQALAGSGGIPIPGGDGGTGTGGSEFGGGFPQYAEGGPVKRTGLALVHEGEYVVSKDQTAQMGNTNYSISVQASGNKQTDEAMVQQLGSMLAQLVRKGKASKLTSALADDGFSRKGRK